MRIRKNREKLRAYRWQKDLNDMLFAILGLIGVYIVYHLISSL